MNQVFEAYQRSSWERFCISTQTAAFRTAVWTIAWNAGRPGSARGYGAGGDLVTSGPRELPAMWGWRASGSLASCPGGMASSAAASLPPLTPPPLGLAGWPLRTVHPTHCSLAVLTRRLAHQGGSCRPAPMSAHQPAQSAGRGSCCALLRSSGVGVSDG